MRKCLIKVETVVLEVELLETPNADALYSAMPFTAKANTWGDEVYFSTPVQCGQEPEASTTFALGEIAFWPPGNAIAILFGATPASHGDEPRLASPGNLWGRASDDVKQLRSVSAGAAITVEQA